MDRDSGAGLFLIFGKTCHLKIPILCILLVLATGASAQQMNTATAQQPPNIILIVADDLGYGDVGYQGQTKIETPNIDRMSRLGMRFTQFYAGTTVCAPSRASLLTGLHTGHTAVRGNRGYEPEGQFPLPDSSLTIASVLQQQGYTTGVFGKWGLGYPGSSGTPLKKGFTDFFGYNCQSLAHNYYPDHLWNNDEKIDLPGNRGKDPGAPTDSVYSADLIHQHALQFLQREATHPFFLFLAYTLPHAALQGPHDSLYQHYVAQFHEAPRTPKADDKKTDYAFEPYPHAAFATMVSRLDHYVGDILQQLEQRGLAGNTLVLFTSDNGPHREGGGDPDFFNSSGGLRGIKRDLYEGGIRVPFIALWKGRITAGSVNNRPWAFWDLFPSFAELAGAPAAAEVRGSAAARASAPVSDAALVPATGTRPAGIDGLSFASLLKAGTQPVKQHDHFYWEFHEGGGSQAVRWSKWKGVRLNVSTIDHPPLELYDLETDPQERTNIAPQHPDIVKQIEAYMQGDHRYNKDWPLLKTEKQ